MNGPARGAPVYILNANTKRESGRKAQLNNIQAARAVADIVRTCLGPQAMLKMILDPMGGILMTNDGNSILREIEVSHPAAKSMIELSRAQDENVGDGTTSVIIVAGEMLTVAKPWIERNIHPRIIIAGFYQALEDTLEFLDKNAMKLNVDDREQMYEIVQSSIGTKFVRRWSRLMVNLALDAVKTVHLEGEGRKEIDIKRYAKIEKIPGGSIEDSCVLRGVMINKDVTHAGMRRKIENPRILLLDCPLEYKKGESMISIEVSKEADFEEILRLEEEYIQKMCEDIIKFRPDVVMTEKGLSDLAQHFLAKANITAFRRLRKTDNNRVARATGATIVHRTDEIQETDIGLGCGVMEVKKIGEEYFVFIDECKDPKACTIILRGASKDVLNEIERNLMDAMSVARNILTDPRLLPGGGATEMAIANYLTDKSTSVPGLEQFAYMSVALALEVIPRTLAQNCGADIVRVLTELRAKHAKGGVDAFHLGIDGEKGTIASMKEVGVWEPYEVKTQTIKTAIEAACMLLRVDDIVSGVGKQRGGGGGGGGAPMPEQLEE